jgi:hypothetical protein
MGMTIQALLPVWAGVLLSFPATRTLIGPIPDGALMDGEPPPRIAAAAGEASTATVAPAGPGRVRAIAARAITTEDYAPDIT